MIAARGILIGLTLAACLVNAGCATVQPWERGTLAKSAMAPDDPSHETTQKLRTYSAKEGGTAAAGVGGGGCGCN